MVESIVTDFAYSNLSQVGYDLGSFLSGLLSSGLIKFLIIMAVLGAIGMIMVAIGKAITNSITR
jgi:hypothetical protein